MVHHVLKASGLMFITIMITGLGDGFAEPVGVTWGAHKYQVSALMGGADRVYTRSLEGSCTVALSAFIFTPMCWFLFPNATSFWATQLCLPVIAAYAEARSPHTMDTPFLFLACGAWLLAALYIPPVCDSALTQGIWGQ